MQDWIINHLAPIFLCLHIHFCAVGGKQLAAAVFPDRWLSSLEGVFPGEMYVIESCAQVVGYPGRGGPKRAQGVE